MIIEDIKSPYIHAASAESFASLVIDNSNIGPVLVNFWSRKAGPCLRQYPILDKVIHHYDGRVLLVNIDTESEIAISSEHGIASVPTLKLFRNGKVVTTLHGFQSEDELIKALDGFVARDSDLKLADAIQLFTDGKAVEAYEMIAAAIVDDPGNHRLPLAMCKLLKHEQRYAEALKLITTLPADIAKQAEVIQFRNIMLFHNELDEEQELDSLQEKHQSVPSKPDVIKQLAIHHIVQQQYEDALNMLVKIIDIDPGFEDNYAQQAMLRIFTIIGTEHELVIKFRPHLMKYAH